MRGWFAKTVTYATYYFPFASAWSLLFLLPLRAVIREAVFELHSRQVPQSQVERRELRDGR